MVVVEVVVVEEDVVLVCGMGHSKVVVVEGVVVEEGVEVLVCCRDHSKVAEVEHNEVVLVHILGMLEVVDSMCCSHHHLHQPFQEFLL